MKNQGAHDKQSGGGRTNAMVRLHTLLVDPLVRRFRAVSRAMRAPAQLVGVLAVTLLAASILIAPVNALWSTNLVLQGSVSLSGLLEGTATPEATASATPTPSTTAEPSTTPRSPTTTPTACAGVSYVDLAFDGNVTLAGESPLDAVLSVTNNGDSIASGVLIGFAPTEGWGFVKRVDFDLPDGQYWLVDGQPAGTLYDLGDLAPGATAQIFLSIQMIEEWQDAPIEARVVFTAAFADLSCPGGDTATATITITRGEISETETPEPDTTPTVGATKTSVPNETETAVTGTPETTTATPESTATEPLPATAIPSETPTPTSTATSTATPAESETSVPITETIVPETAEPSETFEPATETPTPDPSETPTPANTATPAPARTHTSVPTATISATPSIPPTSTVLASAATPPPTVVNTVLGQEAKPRSGQVLPDTGDGARFGERSAGVGLIVLFAAALGFIGVAMGVGRRRA